MDEDVEDFALGLYAWFVETVSHNIDEIWDDTHMITSVEGVTNIVIFIDIGEYFL